MGKETGIKLTLSDVNEIAIRISAMQREFNDQRIEALNLGQEVRSYVFATDINTTSSANLDTSNRTHIPKLAELSDTLQSNYWEAIFGEIKFFQFNGATPEDRENAKNLEAWIRTKLEIKKFRQQVGRKLITDFVIYGNAFMEIDYLVEKDDANQEVFKGITIRRISPLDIVFDASAASFKDTPKIQKKRVHLADLGELPVKFPRANFDEKLINKLIKTRAVGHKDEWVDTLHDENLSRDGYSSWDEYYSQDFAEVLIYRGDVFDPKTGKVQKHRLVWVVDGLHVIRNEPHPSPQGMQGVYHVPWRVRPDNLWGMGALDNLAGMQYRVNKLENNKADILDLIGHPITVHTGGDSLDNIEEDLYKAGNVLSLGENETITFESPNPAALQYGDLHMQQYFKLMEDFAGAPPEERGIRTPGEKTKREVELLDSKGAKLFRDKARIFEAVLEEVLKEASELTLAHFDGNDYVQIFNDVAGEEQLKTLAKEDVKARGEFTAMGSKHWDRKNKRKAELSSLVGEILQDPKYSAHVNAWNLLQVIAEDYELEDTGIFERYEGIKEDVTVQAIAQAESEQILQETGTGGEEAPIEEGQPPTA